MYLIFSNLNSIVNKNILKKKDIGLYVLFRTFSGHFMTIFRSNYFHLKKKKNKFKFELNPLENEKDIGLYVLFRTFFRTFHDNFQVKLFPPKNILIFFLNIR